METIKKNEKYESIKNDFNSFKNEIDSYLQAQDKDKTSIREYKLLSEWLRPEINWAPITEKIEKEVSKIDSTRYKPYQYTKDIIRTAQEIKNDKELNESIEKIANTIFKDSNKIDLTARFSADGCTVGGKGKIRFL